MRLLKPVDFKVLVRPKEVEEKTAGGIILPDQVKEKERWEQREGSIIAVSEEAFTNPEWLLKPKVGDTVIYDKYAGMSIHEDGVEYKLINDKEIGVIVHERD